MIFDYDNDGWPDIYLPNDKAGLKTEKAEWSTGCSFVDVDRDGRADVLSRAVNFSYDSVPRPGQGQWRQWKMSRESSAVRCRKSLLNAVVPGGARLHLTIARRRTFSPDPAPV